MQLVVAISNAPPGERNQSLRYFVPTMTNPVEEAPPSGRQAAEPRQRVGGRSERVVRAVLEAAVGELARVGYAALRVDDVAAGAGVNKTTVYRRWPTKPELVGAALRSLAGALGEAPDTGALRSDLVLLMRAYAAKACRTEGQTISRMLLLEQDEPEVAEIVRTLRADFRAPWEEAVDRAIARGEIPAGSDRRLVVDTLMGAAHTKLYRLREPVEDGDLLALIDLVLAGAKAGGAVRGAPAR
jgi:AcrR family transcriptional regulator